MEQIYLLLPLPAPPVCRRIRKLADNCNADAAAEVLSFRSAREALAMTPYTLEGSQMGTTSDHGSIIGKLRMHDRTLKKSVRCMKPVFRDQSVRGPSLCNHDATWPGL